MVDALIEEFTDWLEGRGAPDPATAERYQGALLVIPCEGPVHVAGEEVVAGGCAVVDGLGEVEFASSGLSLLAQPCFA